MGKASDSGPFCHWGLEQFPDRELFLTMWLWGYWPVKMLLLLGQHSGVTVNFSEESRAATEEEQNRGTEWEEKEERHDSREEDAWLKIFKQCVTIGQHNSVELHHYNLKSCIKMLSKNACCKSTHSAYNVSCGWYLTLCDIIRLLILMRQC